MSTRTNIIVKHGETKLYIYRHNDGYPAATGGDLFDTFVETGENSSKFVAKVLGETYSDGRPVYEVTTGLHGDIEWLYVFDFPTFNETGDKLKISVVEREHATEEKWTEIEEEDAKGDLNLERLAKIVNIDRAKSNEYTAKWVRKALESGENLGYANDSSFYDLIVIEKE